MKKILFIVCLITSQVNAQLAPVILKTVRNRDNSYSIIAKNNSYAIYTVKLNFGRLIGYTTTLNGFPLAYVNRGESQIAKVTAISNASNYSFNYSSQYYMGQALNSVPDLTFSYLLPAMAGKKLVARKSVSLNERLGKTENEAFHSINFIFKLGDTICAARAGIIVAISDTVSIGEKKEQSYSQQRDRITIEHKDGTLAHYTVLAPIKTLVQLGDKVVPGQPIAILNKENEKYILIFSVSYLDSKKLIAFNGEENKKSNYHISIPTNWILDIQKEGYLDTDQITYELRVFHPIANIGIELSKKEKKKLGIQ